MDQLSSFSPQLLLLIAATALAAGVVKGVVGFAMPMIFISILTLFFDQELAIGILILPTLFANFWQVFRQGIGAALASVAKHKGYMITVSIVLLGSAQVVPNLSARTFFLILGIFIVCFTALMLSGWRAKSGEKSFIKYLCALIAGVGGGIAGVWGPPTIVYLSTLNLDKRDHMRAQGGVFGLGGLFLLVGHLRSGIVNETTIPLSLFAIIPACIGVWLGFKVQDRINQRVFKLAILIVLIIAGLNLIRRGIFG